MCLHTLYIVHPLLVIHDFSRAINDHLGYDVHIAMFVPCIEVSMGTTRVSYMGVAKLTIS